MQEDDDMDELMKWATGICISSAVVCIVELFITDMALEKTVRYVLGALMLCSVIIPLGNVIGDFRADFGNVGEYSGELPKEISEQRIEYLESEIKKLIKINWRKKIFFRWNCPLTWILMKVTAYL